MTATRDPDRLLRAWLDLMPDEAPDRAIAAVLQAAETTRQVRALPRIGPWRPPMNRLTLIATAVLVIAALAGGAYLLAGGPSKPALSTPNPTAAPTPTGRPPIVVAPERIWGDWAADVDGIAALGQGPGRIQLSVDWQDGRTLWVQLSSGSAQVLNSNPISATADELTLRAASGGACTAGDIGRYGWSRSADGLFLTFNLIEDACAARATTLARTWVHSLGAVNDGGPGVAYGLTPMVRVDLPTGQRYGANGGQEVQEITTFSGGPPNRAFVVVRNPGGYGAPCAVPNTEAGDIEHTTAAFVVYVKGLPGATVKTSSTTIDGRPAVKLDISIAKDVPCGPDGIQAFHPEDLTDQLKWAFNPAEVESLYIVQMDADTTFLLWYQGSDAEEIAVLESIDFLDKLPTP